ADRGRCRKCATAVTRDRDGQGRPFQVAATDKRSNDPHGSPFTISMAAGALGAPSPPPPLRRANRVRTVLDTVTIEGNPLSLEQATAVLQGKRVRGAPRALAPSARLPNDQHRTIREPRQLLGHAPEQQPRD